MDFTKFLSMLEHEKIFFPRADQFEDPFEGAPSRINTLRFKEQFNLTDEKAADMFNAQLSFQNQHYISCWFASEHESAAMWKLYLQSTEGIAIKTDYESLIRIFAKSDLYIMPSMVNYIDYNTPNVLDKNFFYLYTHKRLSFAHENEFRAIIATYLVQNKHADENSPTILSIDAIPHEYIKSVHISPTSPAWFKDLAENVLTKKYNLTCEIVRSNLYERPTY